MGRAPCCDKANVKKGPWSPEEDEKLKEHIEKNGIGGNWIALPQKAGLKRCGKSCRLRWLNYLRPNIKHGGFTEEEDRIICNLFASIGSRWSVIAAQMPGRTDNDIKNYWNTKLKKKLLVAMVRSPPPPPPPHRHHHASVFSFSSSNSSSSPLSSSSSSLSNNITAYYSPTRSFTALEPISSNISPYPSSLLSHNSFNLVNSQGISSENSTEDREEGSLVNFLYNSGVYHEEHRSNGLIWSGDIDQTPLMDYGLEEIKQLMCSTNTSSCGNNGNFLFDENKTEEKFMLYY